MLQRVTALDMKLGIPAELHIAEFPNRSFAGKVAHTSGAIDPTSRTLLTEVQVPNTKGDLMPGSYAEVTFHLQGGSPPLVIPSNTLVFRSAGTQVVIVDRANTARLRTVKIGRDLGNNLEIISGLEPDDVVILNPPDSISDGTPVAVQRGQTQPPAAAAGH